MSYYESYYDNVNSKQTALKPYYIQGCIARLRGAPKTDNPYGSYKEYRYVNPTQSECKAEWNRGYDHQDAVLAGYMEKTE